MLAGGGTGLKGCTDLNGVALHTSEELGDVAHDGITNDDAELALRLEVGLARAASWSTISLAAPPSPSTTRFTHRRGSHTQSIHWEYHPE